MKKVLIVLIVLMLSLQVLTVNAEIDEKMSCTITYYNNITFKGLDVGNFDNEAHTLKLFYYIDNKNQKLYNSDKQIISDAIFENGTISTNWNSTKDPRFCLFFDKNNKTVQYKAFYTLPPKPIGNTGHVTPPSITKVNGHGTCAFTKL